MFNWIRKRKRNIKPAEHPHKDGFVYWVLLAYELPSNADRTRPVIRVKNDGVNTGDRFMLPHERDTLSVRGAEASRLIIQFGGEDNRPPVFAQIQVSDVEDFRPTKEK